MRGLDVGGLIRLLVSGVPLPQASMAMQQRSRLLELTLLLAQQLDRVQTAIERFPRDDERQIAVVLDEFLGNASDVVTLLKWFVRQRAKEDGNTS